MKDPLAFVTTTGYDAASRAVAVINPLGFMTTTAYDKADRKVSITDAELNITTTVYDPSGRTIATIDGNANITTSVYDPANRLIAIIDVNAHRTSFAYDAANRRIKETNAELGVITIGYDPAGNVTLTLDPRGQGSTNTYDAANRRTLEVFTDGTRNSYTYDNVNNRLTAASPAGIYTSTYDPRNLLNSLQEPGGKFVTYTYDAAQRRISMSAYGKGLFTYTWDAAGRQTKVTSPTLKTTSMSYDGLNRLVQRVYANNAVTTQIFDPAGNLQVIGNVLSTGAVVSRFTYTYDKANHRKTQQEADGTRTSWTYDRAYQLLNEKAAGGPTNTSFNVTHSYDPAGNRTLTKDGTTTTTYTYSVANRLTLAVANGVRTTYSYDLAGNRTKQQSPTFSTIFNWDASGRMISADLVAGIATFTYNADGQRVAKESTNAAVTGFLYDHKKLLHETDAADNILKTYTTTTDEEYGDLISETGESYHQYDAQANTNALIDDAGAIDARYKYFAYGEVSAVNLGGGSTWTKENWSSLPLQLSSDMMAGGKKQYYLDLETGLYLLGTGTNGRYYDPATARFMSEDPVRHESGDPNLFTYVQNDPIDKLDPSGHDDQNQRDEQVKREQADRANAMRATAARSREELPAEYGPLLDPDKSVFNKNRGQISTLKREVGKHEERLGELTSPGSGMVGQPSSVNTERQAIRGLQEQLTSLGAHSLEPDAVNAGPARGANYQPQVSVAGAILNTLYPQAGASVLENQALQAGQDPYRGQDPQTGQMLNIIEASRASQRTLDESGVSKGVGVVQGATQAAIGVSGIGALLVASGPAAPFLLAGLIGYATGADIAERRGRGESLGQALLGVVPDLTGFTSLYKGLTNTDVVTGEPQHLSPQQLGRELGSGGVQFGATVATLAAGTAAGKPAAAEDGPAPRAPQAGRAMPEGEEVGPGEAHIPRSGDEWEAKLKSRYGDENVQRITKADQAEGQEANGTGRGSRPPWLQKVDEGHAFNESQRSQYPYNEIYVYGKKSDYVKLDSYNPDTGEIVSRKFTQLADVKTSTGINYVNNLKENYAAGTRIAKVPSSGDLAGQRLNGQMYLEVPVQKRPVPQAVLEAAKKAQVIIRDINGKVY